MIQSATPSSMKPWARTLWILPAFFLIVGIFQLIGILILGLNPSIYPLQKTAAEETVLDLFSLLGTFTVVGIFRHSIDKESFWSLGFYTRGLGRELIIGLILGSLIMATGFITLICFQEIQWVETKVDIENILLGTCLFVSVAFTEELFVRGYILNNLMKSMHRMTALMVSSVFFSLMHIFNANFSWIGFCNILLAGILLGLPYIYTKSLWLPIALHFSWNFFQGIIFGFNVSGHVTYSLLTQMRTSDNIWNGGKFGFEGSVLSIVFQLIAIVGLWWYYSRKEKDISETLIPEIIPVTNDEENNPK